MDKLSHVDETGQARMVNVGDKQPTTRRAVAEGRVRVSAALIEAVEKNQIAKGNLLDVARLAGIAAAKRTDELIPLCHTLPLEHAAVEAWVDAPFIRVRAQVQTFSKTGVEMEALTAVSVALLTVIDMGKAIDKAMVIEGIRVIEKTGGRHGDYRASDVEAPS
jgi:cyclic pyranopterin phosphate synthase